MSTELFASFENEAAAYRLVELYLWPSGPTCPWCHADTRIGELRGAQTRLGLRKCYHCRKLFTVRSGTVFGSSHVPMHKWLQAIYLTACGTEHISVRQLSDIMNVTHKTAHFMLVRIRRAAQLGGLISSSADATRSRVPDGIEAVQEHA